MELFDLWLKEKKLEDLEFELIPVLKAIDAEDGIDVCSLIKDAHDKLAQKVAVLVYNDFYKSAKEDEE